MIVLAQLKEFHSEELASALKFITLDHSNL
jgi:hypothetical protein